ncbi:hypothetical protein FQA39_LY04017 [Lamprigera yunnana]|nr:hypothetical protein FQA39_LY04017 [Lamprigera yunnana]
MRGCNLRIIYLLITISLVGIHVNETKDTTGTRSLNSHWRENWFTNLFLNPIQDNRQSRFLSLITIVNIDNQDCISATGESGVCVTQSQCLKRGGKPNGGCASGFAYCCVFMVTCGATVRENGTYFVNKEFPGTLDGTGSCQITLVKPKPDVCYFRLDFDQFTLMGPETTNHVCDNDQFIISGGNPVPGICGSNKGNHIIVDSPEGATGPIMISVVTSGPSFKRSWKIRVTQIPCLSRIRGEEGCLQYFTGVAGQIKSFNYDTSTGLQLSNQDYSICIRTERSFCSIHFSQCPDTVNTRSQSFTLTGNSSMAIPAMVGSTGTANFCQNDYLIIPMASNAGRPATMPTMTVDRICGGTFNAEVNIAPSTVKTYVKPYRLWFHTDGVEMPNDIMNRGFCLNYVQQPCTTTTA